LTEDRVLGILRPILSQGNLIYLLNPFVNMPTRHHISRKSANARFAVKRKEAEFTRRKNKAKRLAKLEKKAAAK
jgi:hypothetical protein